MILMLVLDYCKWIIFNAENHFGIYSDCLKLGCGRGSNPDLSDEILCLPVMGSLPISRYISNIMLLALGYTGVKLPSCRGSDIHLKNYA